MAGCYDSNNFFDRHFEGQLMRHLDQESYEENLTELLFNIYETEIDTKNRMMLNKKDMKFAKRLKEEELILLWGNERQGYSASITDRGIDYINNLGE